MQEGKKLEHGVTTILCQDCNKPCTYNRTRGQLCWRCKDARSKFRSPKTVQQPVRCPDCGKKIVIVPCLACKMEKSNAKKETT